MKPVRSSLAAISVGAMMALGSTGQVSAATPQTDTPTATTPDTEPDAPAGSTGSTGSTGAKAPDASIGNKTGGSTGSTGGKTGGKNTGGKSNHGGTSTGNGSTGNGTTGDGTAGDGNSSGSSEDSGITDVVPDTPEPLSIDTPNLSGSTSPTLGGDSTPVAVCASEEGPPKNLVPIYLAAATKYGLGPRGASILAAINRVETDFGRLNQVTSSAGAEGWMQFMPATWTTYGVDADGDGTADPYNPTDAINAAARYLQAAGAPDNWYDAIWAYNHADWYVQDVMDKADCYGTFSSDNADDATLKEYNCDVSETRAMEVPGNYLAAFEDAAARYNLGKQGVWSLAAVARLESDYGRGMTAKQLAATGPMGLTREEWKTYGVDGDLDGQVNRDNVGDSVSTFARMMWANGGVKPGLFAHNHAAWYVQVTMQEAARIEGTCDVSTDDWTIALPSADASSNQINWDNLTILNPAAQNDIQDGLIDARVIKLLAILTQKYTISISALRSDHGMMTASGNISNHYYGRAMDIASVNGVSCTDMSATSPCSEVGRLLTMLPDGVKPTELIYGYDLDGPGPAFALPDHRDHIHAGFYGS